MRNEEEEGEEGKSRCQVDGDHGKADLGRSK